MELAPKTLSELRLQVGLLIPREICFRHTDDVGLKIVKRMETVFEILASGRGGKALDVLKEQTGMLWIFEIHVIPK
jgi:hypothetical protein